jgi:hypothetical protein
MARAWVRQPVRFPGEEPHSKLLLRSSLPPVEKPCPLGRRWTSSPKPSPRSQQVGSSAPSGPQRGPSLQTPFSLFSPFGRETVPAQSSIDFLTQALASVTAGGFVSPFGPPASFLLRTPAKLTPARSFHQGEVYIPSRYILYLPKSSGLRFSSHWRSFSESSQFWSNLRLWAR